MSEDAKWHHRWRAVALVNTTLLLLALAVNNARLTALVQRAVDGHRDALATARVSQQLARDAQDAWKRTQAMVAEAISQRDDALSQRDQAWLSKTRVMEVSPVTLDAKEVLP